MGKVLVQENRIGVFKTRTEESMGNDNEWRIVTVNTVSDASESLQGIVPLDVDKFMESKKHFKSDHKEFNCVR